MRPVWAAPTRLAVPEGAEYCLASVQRVQLAGWRTAARCGGLSFACSWPRHAASPPPAARPSPSTDRGCPQAPLQRCRGCRRPCTGDHARCQVTFRSARFRATAANRAALPPASQDPQNPSTMEADPPRTAPRSLSLDIQRMASIGEREARTTLTPPFTCARAVLYSCRVAQIAP